MSHAIFEIVSPSNVQKIPEYSNSNNGKLMFYMSTELRNGLYVYFQYFEKKTIRIERSLLRL